MDFVIAIRHRIVELNDELTKLNDLLAFYEQRSTVPSNPALTNGNGATQSRHRRDNCETQKILDVTAEYVARVADKDSPVSTRNIVAYLETSGVHISGQNKVSSLSSLLSRSNRFKAIGKSGWILAVPTPEQAEQE